jgi:hypothetical protein
MSAAGVGSLSPVEHQVDAQHHDDCQQQPRPRDRGYVDVDEGTTSPDLATAVELSNMSRPFESVECDSKVSQPTCTEITAGDTGMDRALGSNSPVLTMPPERGTPLQYWQG